MEAAVKFVENNVQSSPSQRELKGCISSTNHGKAIDHHDDENEFSVSNDFLAENYKLTPYMIALRIIHAEDWNDDNKTQKIYNDLQRTQRRDSDLLLLKCCCAKK